MAVDTADPKSSATLESVLEDLLTSRPEIADEIQALQAIFGENKISLHPKVDNPWTTGKTLRLLLETTLPSYEDVEIALILSMPPTYPDTHPPQLQLSGKYVGDFMISSELFGIITRLYMHDDAFRQGEVAIFEGVEKAREEVERYYVEKKDQLAAIEAVDPHSTQNDLELANQLQYEEQRSLQESSQPIPQAQIASLPEGRKLFTSEPIVDRKSIFVGHAFEIRHPSEVSQVVAYLLSDRKIAKAHHPTMLAYRCKGSGNVMHQDNDDDGETAAGSRLAHLLQILELENVLVVVTRWYGGVHLGSDRFKHINQASDGLRDALKKLKPGIQAARDALVLGGFVKPSGKR